jgi:hypothetical protein
MTQIGDLEKFQWHAVAGIFGVNSTESEGEQTGIIREQIRGTRVLHAPSPAEIGPCRRGSYDRRAQLIGCVSFRISVRVVELFAENLVGVAGFEPATPSSRTRCSTRHSQQIPNFVMVPSLGLCSAGLQARRARCAGGLQDIVRGVRALGAPLDGSSAEHRSPATRLRQNLQSVGQASDLVPDVLRLCDRRRV